MTRDYVNYKRKDQRRGGKGLFAVFLLFCGGLLAGLAFYLHQQALTLATLKEMAALKVTTYFSPLQKQQKPPPAKKVAANAVETAKPIHFDFYDELPKARLEAPEEQLEEDAVEEPKTTMATLKKAPPAPKPLPAAVTDSQKKEADIAQELSNDLSSMKAAETASSYILQLSIFHSLDAAKRYRAALASAGLKVDLVKLRLGKDVVYRLQQGPYTTLEQLKQAKKRLSERGVACDIRKLPPYVM